MSSSNPLIYRRTIYDDEYERCQAEIAHVFARKPGLEPGVPRIGLWPPKDALERFFEPLIEKCIDRLVAPPAQLGGEGVISDYTRNVIYCVKSRGLAAQDVPFERLRDELISAARACMEARLTSQPDPELPSRRRLLYTLAIEECLVNVLICLHRTANAMGLGVTAGELRV